MKLLTILFVLLAVRGFSVEKPLIIVTTKPYERLVAELAGEDFAVEAFVPAQENAHHFRPTPQLLQKVSNRVLWFGTGEPLEKKLLSSSFMDLSKGVESHHPWLDPIALKEQLVCVSERLSKEFPEHRVGFESRLKILHKKLDGVHQGVLEIFKEKKPKALVAMHPTLDAFCARYGIELISLEEEGKSSGLRTVETAAQRVAVLGLTRLLSEPDRADALKAAEKLKLKVAFLNPYCDDACEQISEVAKTIRDL